MINTLRWTAAALLLVVGAIHVCYGAFAASNFGNTCGYSYSIWFYIMGLICFIGGAAIVANSRPRIFETLAAICAALLIGIYF